MLPSGLNIQNNLIGLSEQDRPKSVILNNRFFTLSIRDQYLDIVEYNNQIQFSFTLESLGNVVNYDVSNKLVNGITDTTSFYIWIVSTDTKLYLIDFEPGLDRYRILNKVLLGSGYRQISVSVIENQPIVAISLQWYNNILREYITYFSDPLQNQVVYTAELLWKNVRLEDINVYRTFDNESLFLTYFDTYEDYSYNLHYDGYTLPAPRIISIESENEGAVVDWSTVHSSGNITIDYILQRSESEDFQNPLVVYSGLATIYTDYQVQVDMTYYYRVKSHIDTLMISSIWSEPRNITILSADSLRKLKPILTNKKKNIYNNYYDEKFNLKLETFIGGRLSYVPGMSIEIYSNHTGFFEKIIESVTDFEGMSHLIGASSIVNGVRNCLMYAIIKYNNRTYKSNVIRCNFNNGRNFIVNKSNISSFSIPSGIIEYIKWTPPVSCPVGNKYFFDPLSSVPSLAAPYSAISPDLYALDGKVFSPYDKHITVNYLSGDFDISIDVWRSSTYSSTSCYSSYSPYAFFEFNNHRLDLFKDCYNRYGGGAGKFYWLIVHGGSEVYHSSELNIPTSGVFQNKAGRPRVKRTGSLWEYYVDDNLLYSANGNTGSTTCDFYAGEYHLCAYSNLSIINSAMPFDCQG